MKAMGIVSQTQKDLEFMYEDIKRCSENISKCQEQINLLYHDLETRNFNAFEGWVLAKELQKVLQERRAWKQRKYETKEAFNQLGGVQRLNALKKHQKRRLDKFMKRNSWFDHFSEESKAILAGHKV